MVDSRRSRQPSSRTATTVSLLAGAAVLLLCAGVIVGVGAYDSETGRASPASSRYSAAPHTSGKAVERPPLPAKFPRAAGPKRSPSVVPAGRRGNPAVTLTNNPINGAGLRATDRPCALPRFDSSDAGQEIFYQAALSCLNNTWEPVFQAANLPFHRPNLTLVTTDVQTPCGRRSPDRTALYCDGTLYMTSSYYRDVEGHGDDASVYFGQIAHEYGHHIQQLTGMMDASWQRRSLAGKKSPAGYEISRRLEMQATCYGGMFLGALRDRGTVDPGLIAGALTDAGERGDDGGDGQPRDHGTPQTNAAWVLQGYEKNQTYQCNTWLAPAETVR